MKKFNDSDKQKLIDNYTNFSKEVDYTYNEFMKVLSSIEDERYTKENLFYFKKLFYSLENLYKRAPVLLLNLYKFGLIDESEYNDKFNYFQFGPIQQKAQVILSMHFDEFKNEQKYLFEIFKNKISLHESLLKDHDKKFDELLRIPDKTIFLRSFHALSNLQNQILSNADKIDDTLNELVLNKLLSFDDAENKKMKNKTQSIINQMNESARMHFIFTFK